MDIGTLIVIILVLLALNSLVGNWLVKETEGLRMDIAMQAKRLLASEHLGEKERHNILVACEISMPTRGMWWIMALISPFYFIYAMIWDRKLLEDEAENIRDEKTRAAYIEIRNSAVFLAMLFSPISSRIVITEMKIFLLLFKLVSHAVNTAFNESSSTILHLEACIQDQKKSIGFSTT